ncbi:hypothetical protein LEM8419_00237 [Neolewinella maritima]|uniref:Secretion system C-terminal sorting domain-containing protein n=1 Tax=Neolewinella maritima TaxID=1383882 RepID=A0ABN8EYR8_9BACT|nr:choice-of-anchor Q domain-containing protein [Neolewinella maritima]CAH0998942.1 hypothetical protein LEM8419_00237 [Neolewinella maritima]
MQHNYLLRCCLLLAVSLFSLNLSLAATLPVTSTADDGDGTLRQAVRQAQPGDTIVFAARTDRRAITLRTVINIEKDLVVLGNGMDATYLRGNNTNRAFSVRKGASVVIKDLRIYDGLERIGGGLRVRATSTLEIERVYIYDCIANGPVATQGGGAVYNEGVLTIKASKLMNNAATGPAGSGGAVFNALGATLTIMGSRIERNVANRAGGGIEDASGSGSMVLISETRINRNVVNTAPGNGGGIHIGSDGDLTLIGGTIDLNEAGQEGGGVWNGTGTLTIQNTLVRQNVAKGKAADNGGGGLYNNGGGTIVLSDNARILNNKATGMSGSGGGILNNTGATLRITDSQVSGNEANRAGGGIEDASGAASAFTITNSSIDDNVVNTAPGNGGGIHIGGDGSLTVSGGSVSGNSAGAEGGGIWNNLGTLTVTDRARIRSNVAMGDDADMGGGGLYNNGGGTIVVSNGVSIRGNKATGTSGSGGGILNNTGATLRIANSRIEANTANRAGGGIEDASGAASTFTISSTTIDRNVVNTAPGNGGGIHIGGDGDLTIMNSIVTGNMAGQEGGGIWNGAGTLTVSATEISDNTGMGDDADDGGGGLFNNGMGTILVNNSQILRNRATGTSGSGGGILNNTAATLTITDSRIERNEANRAGGGIEDASGNTTLVSITNTRINRNVVNTAPGNGGGIHVGSNGDVMLTGGTVDLNEAGQEGGGLWNGAGTMTVSNTLIRNNVAKGDDANDGGGGLFNNGGGTIVLRSNTRVFGNKATGTSGSGGGILNNMGAALRITDSQVSDNEANRAGGGIEDASGATTEFTVTNTAIERNVVNTAPGNGGGIHIGSDGDLTITGGMVNNNTAGQEGGGIWNSVGTTTVNNVLIRDNVALGDDADDGGGGLFNNGGTLVVNAARLHGNQATGTSGSGGALLSTGGSVRIDRGTIRNNTANRAGGGVEVIDGSYASTAVVYDGNDAGSAPGNGGAFHVTGMMSTVDITGGSITNNTAANEGGGVWNQSGTMMSLMKVSIRSNTVTDEGTLETRVAGAGVFNNGGILDIESSTIADNRMTGKITAGGGIANNTGGTLTLLQSTVSGNQGGLAGGGIANDGTMEIVNSTIAMNNARGGGGFAQATHSASLTITGTIIAQNSANLARDFATVAGMVTSNGYNLIGEDLFNQFPATATDKENVPAALFPLADNGGMTMTHALRCVSPAVDMGDPDDESVDQIDQAVFGARRDIGSFERQSACGQNAPAVAAGEPTTASTSTTGGTLSVFPNPAATDYLMVNLPAHFTGDVGLKITGMDGRVRNAGTIQSQQHRLDLSAYATGTYTLQVINGDEVQSIRFVVSR